MWGRRWFAGTAVAVLLSGLAPGGLQAAPININLTFLEPGTQTVGSFGDVSPAAFSDRQKDILQHAADFWEDILTGFSDVTRPLTTQILMSMDAGDGPGRLLALASADFTETLQGFVRTRVGRVGFDVADFTPGDTRPEVEAAFLDTAIHEIAHVMGFGTLWRQNGLLGSGQTYVGEQAIAAFNTDNGVEVSDLRLDEVRAHWSECYLLALTDPGCDPNSASDRELMTPYFDGGSTLSAATIAAFRDLGYTTIDPFSGVGLPPVPAPAVPLPAGGLLMVSALAVLPAGRVRVRF